MQFSALFRQNSNRAIGERIERMVRLEGTDEDARVDKHVLDAGPDKYSHD